MWLCCVVLCCCHVVWLLLVVVQLWVLVRVCVVVLLCTQLSFRAHLRTIDNGRGLLLPPHRRQAVHENRIRLCLAQQVERADGSHTQANVYTTRLKSASTASIAPTEAFIHNIHSNEPLPVLGVVLTCAMISVVTWNGMSVLKRSAFDDCQGHNKRNPVR